MPCGLFFCKKKVRRLKIKRSLIARAPFSGVAAKKVVRIPQKIRYQGVNFSVTAIADKAFYKNKKLEKVEIGSSVRTIGSRAFYQTKKLKVSCLCSQLSFIFGHPSPSTSMYFALFPYYFPCEESIREKVFFRLNRSLLLYPKVLLNFSWLPL